jgi:dynein intermediate chain 3, axonemal
MDPEGSDFEENQDDDDKKEYVKKEYYARPYESDGITEAAVNALIIKNTRPVIKMRVSKMRKEFGLDNFQMIEKDAADLTIDLKFHSKPGNIQHIMKKKVLSMGLQAARPINSFQSQTYHKRSVNAAVQYRPDDFIDKIRQQSTTGGDLNEKLDKFIDRVQYRVEEALQSNEIINVFQDDFEMLGDEDAAAGGQNANVNVVPRTYFEQEYCKSKTVSCIRFHPTKEHLVAISLVEHFKTYEDRVNLLGISFDSYVLILNFKDPHIITLNYILQTPVEITTFEFHPENPRVVVGGAING